MIRRVGRPGVGQKKFKKPGFELWEFQNTSASTYSTNDRGPNLVLRTSNSSFTAADFDLDFNILTPGDIIFRVNNMSRLDASHNWSSGGSNAKIYCGIYAIQGFGISGDQNYKEEPYLESDSCEDQIENYASFSSPVYTNNGNSAEIQLVNTLFDAPSFRTTCQLNVENSYTLLIRTEAITNRDMGSIESRGGVLIDRWE